MLVAMARADFKAEDFWNGHAYLAHQIGSMALQHRDVGHSYPAGLTHGEWQDVLTRIGEPLMAYAAGIDHDEGVQERQEAAKAALELFASWFDKFWD